MPLTVVVTRAAPRARRRGARDRGRRHRRGDGGERALARAQRARRLWATRTSTSILLEGGPHLAGAFLDAGEIDEIRLFLAPLVIGGRAGARPARGRGRRADLRGAARADARLRAGRRRPADQRPPAGVVTCSPGWSRTWATVDLRGRDARTACGIAITSPLARRAQGGRQRRRQRRLPDRDRALRRRAVRRRRHERDAAPLLAERAARPARG